MKLLLLSALLLCQDVGSLIEQLDDRDPDVREKAEAELVKKGPAALPALEKAAKDGPEEVRARAASAAHRIRWNDMAIPVAADLRDLLRTTLASGDFSGDGGRPLETAFTETSGALEEAKIPEDRAPWSFLDPAPYTRSYRSAAKDEKLTVWRLGGEGVVLHAVSGPRVPRFYVVRKNFDLAKASWDEKAHAIPALADVAKGAGWGGLFLASRTAGKGWVLFTFCWEQDKPYPNLRHVLITESFAVLAIGYQ